MYRLYITILRERSQNLLRDAQLRCSQQNIVDGRVVSSDVVCMHTTPLDTTNSSTIFYWLHLNWASLRRLYEHSLRMAM
jgi:hypothetical protein